MTTPPDIYKRVLDFASRVLKMERALARDPRVNRNALSQLANSASSIGANLEEAKAGQSRADFHAKLRISLKEARESLYWLRLLHQTDSINPGRIQPLITEANEIVAILTVIARKTNPRNPAIS